MLDAVVACRRRGVRISRRRPPEQVEELAGPKRPLRPALRPLPAVSSGPETLEALQQTHLRRALEETRWVIGGPRGAAHRLGVNASTLRPRMKKLGLRRPR